MTFPPGQGNPPQGQNPWNQPQQPQGQDPWGQQPGYSAPQPPGYQDPQQPPMQQPPMQPPGYGAMPPGAQPPPGMPQPGYQDPQQTGYLPPQQTGYPGYGSPQYGVPVPPPGGGSSKAPLIVGLVIGVVLLLGIGTAAVLFAAGGDPVAQPSGSASASASPSASPSPSPSPSPSVERLSYEEFADDWKFKLGDVELSADYVKGWDYEDCGEFENDEALTDMDCVYGFEVAFEAEKGKLKFVHLVLGMVDEEAAEDAAVKGEIEEKDFDVQPDSFIDDFSYGRWQITQEDEFVIITICTATKSVKEKKADKYLRYASVDMRGALMLK